VNSGVASSPTKSADVAVLRAQYLAAFERYRAYVTKLVEYTAGTELPPPMHLLDAERQMLQEYARTRAALIEALSPVEAPVDARLLSDARDEAIRRSIAKRNDPDPDELARKQRLAQRRKRSRLFAVSAERTAPEPEAERIDELLDGGASELAS
jgi:hypothetical protein